MIRLEGALNMVQWEYSYLLSAGKVQKHLRDHFSLTSKLVMRSDVVFV